MAARIIVRIELTPEAKSQLSVMCQKAGMTQVSLLSRLVEWFSRQPDIIQAAVMGDYPAEVEAEIAQMLLKHMAGKKVG
jgi:hypothetical protein